MLVHAVKVFQKRKKKKKKKKEKRMLQSTAQWCRPRLRIWRRVRLAIIRRGRQYSFVEI